jgi:hypothetical protein
VQSNASVEITSPQCHIFCHQLSSFPTPRKFFQGLARVVCDQ